MRQNIVQCMLSVLIVLGMVKITSAADTTEVFDIGYTDYEIYAVYEGVGLDKEEQVLGFESAIGIGLTGTLSGLFSASWGSDPWLYGGIDSIGGGLFWTVMDRDTFDLDLYANLGASPDGDFSLAPGLEFNLDFPRFSIYTRYELQMAGRDDPDSPDPANPDHETALTSALNPGIYYNLSDSQQLLLEYTMSIRHNALDDEETTEIGGLVLGYNIVLSEAVELITEIGWDIPQDDEDSSRSVSIGIIVTVP